MGDVMAEAYKIWTTTGGKYHAALSPDFDPATDEVIVVKKDAARVWVEGLNQSRYLHTTCPVFSFGDWTNLPMNYEGIGGLLPQIKNEDCVEFIAIKTHRPPVEHEAKLPEPVAELVSATDSILPPGCSMEIVSAPVPSAGQGVA